jgi:hypothetical protein
MSHYMKNQEVEINARKEWPGKRLWVKTSVTRNVKKPRSCAVLVFFV